MPITPQSSNPASALRTPLIVWFDGACPLCRREIAAMRWLDFQKRIIFLDIGSEMTDCPIDRRTLLVRFHAQENGVIVSGAAAFAAMWRAIPLLRPLGMLSRNRAVLVLLERLYLRFLTVRPALRQWLS